MVLTASNVRVGTTGAIYKAPLGSTAPTDSTTALDVAFLDLGYVSEDGVTESWDETINTITAWQNATNVRTATTSSIGMLQFTLIETNKNVIEAYYRGSTVTEPVPASGDFQLDIKPIVSDPSNWVLDVLDGTKNRRIYIANGEVVERGDVIYQNGEPVGYQMTVHFYPDANGNLGQVFTTDTAWDPT